MNTYIKNKLDEFDSEFTDTERENFYSTTTTWKHTIGVPVHVKMFIEKAITDYHNHIVDIIDGQTIIATDDTQFGLHTDGYNNAIEDILSILQDTNPKE